MKCWWIVSVEHDEWGLACSGVLCTIIGKFSCWQVVNPVILIVVDETVKVLLQHLIESFCLSICLQVIGCRHLVLNAKLCGQHFPKLIIELSTMI